MIVNKKQRLNVKKIELKTENLINFWLYFFLRFSFLKTATVTIQFSS